MKSPALTTTVFAATSLIAAAAFAQTPPPSAAPPPAQPPLMIDKPEVHVAKSLTVSSADFEAGGDIPLVDSGYGASRSPALRITGAPPATRTFVIVMEDADAALAGEPILHWMAYNLAGGAEANLPGGMPAGATLTSPVALMQAKSVRGQPAYWGPHPTPASGQHRYHLQVFALDIGLSEVPDRKALGAAMSGHVLAEGELVGAFTAPGAPPKPAA